MSAPQEITPKLLGADVELANAIVGGGSLTAQTGWEASALLLREVHGIPGRSSPIPVTPYIRSGAHMLMDYNAIENDRNDDTRLNDIGRLYRTNGGCVYIDMSHLEVALPEVLNARDWVKYFRAMLRVARDAQACANARLAPENRVIVCANNSDGSGSSWGSHFNLLLSRKCFNDIFYRRMHSLAWLASFNVSAVIFSGQGKVGAENGMPPVEYQLGQRADFLTQISAGQTTFARPIANSRDEALCGAGIHTSQYARLHHICWDSTLSDHANYVKAGSLQIAGAMLEVEAVNPSLILKDPVEAGIQFSHDPELRAAAETIEGVSVTALDLQRRIHDEAARLHAQGRFDGAIPHVEDILESWGSTLDLLAARNWGALAGKLDWVLKRIIIEQAIEEHAEFTWDSPEAKHLDFLFASLDEDEGLFWAYDRAGIISRLCTEEEVSRAVVCPPGDTRAWLRGRLVAHGCASDFDEIDWDRIVVRNTDRPFLYKTELDLSDPFSGTAQQLAHIFRQNKTASFDALVDMLVRRQDRSHPRHFIVH